MTLPSNKMSKTMGTTRQGGFTLVEMALVLVIIGLILGAVSIGKDLQRTSEYNKIKQKFVDQWVQAYNQYYIRTGVVLGDSQETPTMAVNAKGETTTTTGGTTTTSTSVNAFLNNGSGDYSGVTPPPRLCQGDSNDSYTGARSNVTKTLHSYLDALGIRMPPGRAEGREDRYVYLDTNGNPQEIQICFQWNPPGTPSGAGNVMVLTGLTPDLARMLDGAIDGQANAAHGAFREQGQQSGSTHANWTFTNTDQIGSSSAGATANDDDAQVKVVTAHYKMNQ